VANTDDGDRLLHSLKSKAVNCMFVCADTTPKDLKTAATKLSNGDLDVLISTSIALVGNENPSCRFLICAGYLFDAMQVVQAFGRLRKYMRSSAGQVCFAPPDHRIKEDQHRYTRLFNGKLISEKNNALFKATMTSGGVHDWMIDAASGTKACPLKKLSLSFGKMIDNCTACLFCRTIPINKVQVTPHRK
jgi:superfamily II DNA helicase RecQ